MKSKFIVHVKDKYLQQRLHAVLRLIPPSYIVMKGEFIDSFEIRNSPDLTKILILDLEKTFSERQISFDQLRLMYPKIRIVCFKNFWTDQEFSRAVKYGVTGICTWNSSIDDLKYVFQNIQNGLPSITADLISRLITYHQNPERAVKDVDNSILSQREKQILVLLLQGYDLHEVSSVLNMKYETSRSHLKNIYRKLNVKTMLQAVLKYIKLSPDSISQIRI